MKLCQSPLPGPRFFHRTQFLHTRLLVILKAIRRVESEHCVHRSIFASTHCADVVLSSSESCRLFWLSVPWLWSNRPERCARTCREESSLTTFSRLTQLICTFPLSFHFPSLIPLGSLVVKAISQCWCQVTTPDPFYFSCFHNVIAEQLWWYIVSVWHIESADTALIQLSAFFMSLKLSSTWGQILCWNLGTTAGLCIYE